MTVELNDLLMRVEEIRDRLRLGQKLTLTDGGQTVAQIVPNTGRTPDACRRLGFAKGTFPTLPPDFNDPLPEEFWLGSAQLNTAHLIGERGA